MTACIRTRPCTNVKFCLHTRLFCKCRISNQDQSNFGSAVFPTRLSQKICVYYTRKHVQEKCKISPFSKIISIVHTARTEARSIIRWLCFTYIFCDAGIALRTFQTLKCRRTPAQNWKLVEWVIAYIHVQPNHADIAPITVIQRDCVHFNWTENDLLSPNIQLPVCDVVIPKFCPTHISSNLCEAVKISSAGVKLFLRPNWKKKSANKYLEFF